MPSSTESPVAVPTSQEDSPPGPQVSQDLVGGLVLGSIVAVFLLRAGPMNRDWVFPLVLAWATGVVSAYLVVRGLLGHGERISARPTLFRGGALDIGVFIAMAVAYVALLRPLGYWIMTSVMIFAASQYLDTRRSRANVVISAVVAIVVSLGAFLLLTKVFYVPVPKARWLPL